MSNRDSNNNLLSIDNSEYTPNNSGSYVNLSSSITYNDDHINKLIDFDFKDFTDGVYNINNLPDELMIVTKSDYYDLQLKLQETSSNLELNKNIYEIEKDTLIIESDALFKTIESIHKTANTVVKSLQEKYSNNIGVFSDISSLYYIYSSSFDYIIQNSSSLVNRTKTFIDKGWTQHSGSYIPVPIEENKIIYNLQFNDNFLDIYGDNTFNVELEAVRSKYNNVFAAASNAFAKILEFVNIFKFNRLYSGTDVDDSSAVFDVKEGELSEITDELYDIKNGPLSSVNYYTISTEASELQAKYEKILIDIRNNIIIVSNEIINMYASVSVIGTDRVWIPWSTVNLFGPFWKTINIYGFTQIQFKDINDKILVLKNMLVSP